MPRLLEIACFNEQSAIIAQKAGADRIELCVNYKEGGLSPSLKMIETSRNAISIPIVVMLRPRPGNFIYTRSEFESLKTHLELCRRIKVDGVVFGTITKEGDVDKEVCRELLKLAGSMKVCFHRAIDLCREIDRQLETLIELGIHRVLTSGGQSNAIEGKENLARWQKRYGAKIGIMPGGGLRSGNIQDVILTTGCNEFHSAAILNESETASAFEVEQLANIIHRS